MVEKLKAVTAENLALHVAPDYEIAMASTWERKRKVHGKSAESQHRAIQDDDRMVPIKSDIVSLFNSQSRQRYQVSTGFSDKKGVMKN